MHAQSGELRGEKPANGDRVVASIEIQAPSGSESCVAYYFQGKYIAEK